MLLYKSKFSSYTSKWPFFPVRDLMLVLTASALCTSRAAIITLDAPSLTNLTAALSLMPEVALVIITFRPL
jgi:hypothetical protein